MPTVNFELNQSALDIVFNRYFAGCADKVEGKTIPIGELKIDEY